MARTQGRAKAAKKATPAKRPAEVQKEVVEEKVEPVAEDVVEEVAEDVVEPEACEPECEECQPDVETFKALVITKKDRNTLKVAEVRVDADGNIVELVDAKKGLKFQIIRTLMRTLQRF